MLNQEGIICEKGLGKEKGSEMPLTVIGDINFGKYSNHMLSINLEGKIDLHEPMGNVVWSLDLEEEIIGVYVKELSNSKEQELCVCTWDGMTHIIDFYKNDVRFNFRDRICSFIIGEYSLEDQKKNLCIFYVTFNDKIVMYTDVKLDSIPSYTMLELVEMKGSKELNEKLNSFSLEEKTKLFNSLLYQK